ncbi:MAG: hypothetical protein ACLP0J_14265 [Solirubrobacteraceae bacterium]
MLVKNVSPGANEGSLIPTGLDSARTGQPLAEALAFNTPLQGVVLPSQAKFPNPLPDHLTIAEPTGASPGIITAIKRGDLNSRELVLRLYQPTNEPLEITVAIAERVAAKYRNSGRLAVEPRTALEQPLINPLQIHASASTFSVLAPHALTTVALDGGLTPT